uniref:Proteasome maturation factor UMP1 n=1 Tax=Peronospora matthiolae TaxID=2874970 RepID=A0AAV1V1J3_9STRA
MNSSSLPLVRAPPDTLRFGFYSASEDVRSLHEVQRLQTTQRQSNWELKMATVEQIYGKAAAMRLRTEKSVLEQFTRFPGLPSSHAGLDTLTGADEQIEFADFLNDPDEHPENTFRIHEAMEVKLSIF